MAELGRARAYEKYHQACFESKLFLYKSWKPQARAYFKLFKNQAHRASSLGLIYCKPKIRPGPSIPSPGSFHFYAGCCKKTNLKTNSWFFHQMGFWQFFSSVLLRPKTWQEIYVPRFLALRPNPDLNSTQFDQDAKERTLTFQRNCLSHPWGNFFDSIQTFFAETSSGSNARALNVGLVFSEATY